MVIRKEKLNKLGILIEKKIGKLRGMKRVEDEGRRIRRKRNDIDILEMKIGKKRMKEGEENKEEGEERVNGRIEREEGDIGEGKRIERERIDIDDEVIDLRKLNGEEIRNELRMGERKENMREKMLEEKIIEIGEDEVEIEEGLERDKLVEEKDRLEKEKIKDKIEILEKIEGEVEDLEKEIIVLVIMEVKLGLEKFMKNKMIGRMGWDEEEINRRKMIGNEVEKMRIGIKVERNEKRNMSWVIIEIIKELKKEMKIDIEGIRIDVGEDIDLMEIERKRGIMDRIGNGRKKDIKVNRIIEGERIGDMKKIKNVRNEWNRYIIGVE